MKYRGNVRKEKKEGGEVVTVADREASSLIVSTLQRAFPNHLVVSEESKENWDQVKHATHVWFVDPIDGTKEYLEGTPNFAVQIALVERTPGAGAGRPVLGVVYQPVLDRLYHASPGAGTYLVEQGRSRRLRVAGTSDPARLRLLVSNSNRDESIDDFKLALGIGGEVPMGSVGVKLGLIAGGEHDITFKPSRVIKAWDIAAPQAILEGAGGRFTRMDGQPFRYDDIHNTGGLLASNGAAHDEIAERIAPIYRDVAARKDAEDAAKKARKAAKKLRQAAAVPGMPGVWGTPVEK
jgi:3'(2'), 5'-bisphosphate nucleotidase